MSSTEPDIEPAMVSIKSDGSITLHGVLCEPFKDGEMTTIDVRRAGYLEDSVLLSIFNNLNATKVILYHENLLGFLESILDSVPYNVTVEIFDRCNSSEPLVQQFNDENLWKICSIGVDQHGVAFLDLSCKALKGQPLKFVSKKKLQQLILRDYEDGIFGLHSDGTFDTLEELIVADGRPGERTLIVDVDVDLEENLHVSLNGLTLSTSKKYVNRNSHEKSSNLDLGVLSSIKKLFVSAGGVTVSKTGLEKLHNLEEVTLIESSVSDDRVFWNMIKVKTLSLVNCDLHRISLDLGKFPELQEFCLHGSTFNFSELIIPKTGKLRKLDMSSCRLTQLSVGLEECPELQELNLSYNDPFTVNTVTFPKLRNLKKLDLSSCDFELLPSGLGECSQLQELNLSKNELRGVHFATFPKLRYLKKLDLSSCKLRLLPRGLGECSELQELNLSGNKLLAVFLLTFSELRNLKKLDLSDCGLEVLPCHLDECSELRELDVSFNFLVEGGLVTACNFPKLMKLVDTSVTYTKSKEGVWEKKKNLLPLEEQQKTEVWEKKNLQPLKEQQKTDLGKQSVPSEFSVSKQSELEDQVGDIEAALEEVLWRDLKKDRTGYKFPLIDDKLIGLEYKVQELEKALWNVKHSPLDLGKQSVPCEFGVSKQSELEDQVGDIEAALEEVKVLWRDAEVNIRGEYWFIARRLSTLEYEVQKLRIAFWNIKHPPLDLGKESVSSEFSGNKQSEFEDQVRDTKAASHKVLWRDLKKDRTGYKFPLIDDKLSGLEYKVQKLKKALWNVKHSPLDLGKQSVPCEFGVSKQSELEDQVGDIEAALEEVKVLWRDAEVNIRGEYWFIASRLSTFEYEVQKLRIAFWNVKHPPLDLGKESVSSEFSVNKQSEFEDQVRDTKAASHKVLWRDLKKDRTGYKFLLIDDKLSGLEYKVQKLKKALWNVKHPSLDLGKPSVPSEFSVSRQSELEDQVRDIEAALMEVKFLWHDLGKPSVPSEFSVSRQSELEDQVRNIEAALQEVKVLWHGVAICNRGKHRFIARKLSRLEYKVQELKKAFWNVKHPPLGTKLIFRESKTIGKTFINPKTESTSKKLISPETKTIGKTFINPKTESTGKKLISPETKTIGKTFINPKTESTGKKLISPETETIGKTFINPKSESTGKKLIFPETKTIDLNTIYGLPKVVYQSVCLKINKQVEGGGFNVLASHLGYSGKQIRRLKSSGDPANALFFHWATQPGNTLDKLLDTLTQVGRHDVVKTLKSAQGHSTRPSIVESSPLSWELIVQMASDKDTTYPWPVPPSPKVDVASPNEDGKAESIPGETGEEITADAQSSLAMSFTVDAKGKRVDFSPASAILQIPAEAVLETVTLTCKRIRQKNYAIKARKGESFCSSILNIGPDAVGFKKPVPVYLAHSAAEDGAEADYYDLVVQRLKEGCEDLKTERISRREDLPEEIVSDFNHVIKYLPYAKTAITETCTLVVATRIRLEEIVIDPAESYVYSKSYGDQSKLEIAFPAGVVETKCCLGVQLFPADEILDVNTCVNEDLVCFPIIKVTGQVKPFLKLVHVELLYTHEDVADMDEQFFPVGSTFPFSTKYGVLLRSHKHSEANQKWSNVKDDVNAEIKRLEKNQIKITFSLDHFCELCGVVKKNAEVSLESLEGSSSFHHASPRSHKAIVLAVHDTNEKPNTLSAVLAPKSEMKEVERKWGFEGEVFQKRLRCSEEVYFCVPLPERGHLFLPDDVVRFLPDEVTRTYNNVDDGIDLKGRDKHFLLKQCAGDNHFGKSCFAKVRIRPTVNPKITSQVQTHRPTASCPFTETGPHDDHLEYESGSSLPTPSSQNEVWNIMKSHCELFEEKFECEVEKKLAVIDDLVERPTGGKASDVAGVAAPVTTVVASLACGVALAVSLSTYGVGSFVGALVAFAGLAVTKIDRRVKQRKAKVVQNVSKSLVSSVLKCIVKEVAKELSRIFEYQLFMLQDKKQLEVVARYAVDVMLDLKEGEVFDRNTLLRKILAGKSGKKKELITRDGKKDWLLPDMFRKPGLRKAALATTPKNQETIFFKYMKKPDSTCDVTMYGYRGEVLELKFTTPFVESREAVVESASDEGANGFDNTCAKCLGDNANAGVSGNGSMYFAESDIDREYNSNCPEPNNYLPFHCLVRCPKVLEAFACNLEKERLLVNYIREVYALPSWQILKPVYRPHSPRRIPHLREASLRGADFSHADFTETNLEGCDLSNCSILFGEFQRAVLTGAKFVETHISHCNFICAVAQRCEWTNVKVHHSCVRGADIRWGINTLGGNDWNGTSLTEAFTGNMISVSAPFGNFQDVRHRSNNRVTSQTYV